MNCSFITKNRQQWLEDAAAGDNTTSTDNTDGSIPSLEQCVESLYSTTEERLLAAGRIASLLSADIDDADTISNNEPTKTLDLVAGNSQLLSALTRMLREDCVSAHICQIFFQLSLFPDYHPLLLSNGIGSLLMDVLIRETNRTCGRGEEDGHGEETRDDESSSFDAGAAAADTDADAITCSSRGSSTVTTISSAHSSSSSWHRTFSSKREKIINLCLAILDNLADDLKVRRKMLKSGQLLAPLLVCLKCKTTDCIVRSLLLLRKASLFEEVVAELAQNNGKALRAIIRLATEGEAVIADHALRLLFNSSFYRECRKIITNNQELIDVLTSMTRNKDSPSSCQVCVNLLKVLCLEMLECML